MKNPNDESVIQKETSEQVKLLTDAYGEGTVGDAERNYAQRLIQQVNDDLTTRENTSMVTNGLSYSKAYEYNQKQAINYSPKKDGTDRQVSLGMVHEKIVSFVAIFLKYIFKRKIKCYDENGKLVRGMGRIYDLAIEFSLQMELFKKKIALIYWELFSQGNAFVLEDWEVAMKEYPVAYFKTDSGDKVLVTADNMDYTYEFLDGLTYEKGKEVQKRRAVSIVLDGRQVIFGNPEIEELQDQPRITIERELSRADAEAVYSTLNKWKFVPTSDIDITTIVGERATLFDVSRLKKPADNFIEHRVWDKESNRFNIFLNGLMMLPSKTPMSLFYPRCNYPISNIPCERLRGSIYARSIPAKTKFNADFIDWALRLLAEKFEQGIRPAILSKGKYTLTSKIFRGGQVTHGISSGDYEKADPENKGITNNDVSFFDMVKEVLQAQTVNPTTSGELSSNATATEIATVDNNQRDKLAFLLDALIGGFFDIYMRRAETIESKYTIKQKETVVDGKKVAVYQNFCINISGIEHNVVFDNEVGGEGYDEQGMKDKLFQRAFKDKEAGKPSEYYLVNPDNLRNDQYTIIMEVAPEKIKDNQLAKVQMFEEFTQLLNLFGRDIQGGEVSTDELKKEYLEISGKPDELFTSDMYKKLEQQQNSIQNPQDQPVVETGKAANAKPIMK